MPFLVKKTATVKNRNGETFTHEPDTVLSDWEINDIVEADIERGSAHARSLFERLTEGEAEMHRIRATKAEGSHVVEGEDVEAPFEDYVGLHPDEIVDRMRSCDLDKVQRIKLYERGGMNRQTIVDFVAPAEHAPFKDYDDMQVLSILEKMSLLTDHEIADLKIYEAAHKKRPAVLEYDRETYELPAADGAPQEVGTAGTSDPQEGGTPALAGAAISSQGAD